MNYFEDLNPYFVRQDPDAEVNPDGTLIPPKNPNPAAVPQIYMGNIIRLNIGKLGTFYFTYSDSEKWRDEVFVGIVEDAGRDYFIIKDVNSEDRFLLPLVYFLWARFKGAISFTVPPQYLIIKDSHFNDKFLRFSFVVIIKLLKKCTSRYTILILNTIIRLEG